ncbi:MAG: alpha/beta hydrolase [Kineosporiaceae bacterium]
MTAPSAPRPVRASAVALLAATVVLAGCTVARDDASAGGTSEEPRPSAAASQSGASATARPTTLEDYLTQTVEWGSCDEFEAPPGATSDGFECGYLLVPLRYDDPAGDTVEIAVNRRPARGGEARGALVVNPGGPGGSGVDHAFGDTFTASAAVVAEYDLVGFDPRGVARSEGVDCLDDEEVDAYLAADRTPDIASERAEYRGLLEDLARGCAGETPLVAHMGTEDVARDVDVLRAALGEDRLNWLGKSYGTQLGAVYAQLFPDRVGRMVLDGGVDPRSGVTGSQAAVEQIAGFELALESFVEDCLARAGCPLTGTTDQGVSQVVRFVERLDAAPLPTGDEERPLTQGLAVYGVFAPLYQRDAWQLLREALGQGFEGDASTLLVLADLYSQREGDGSYRGNAVEAMPAVSCLDVDPDAPEEDPVEVQRALEAAAPELGPLFDSRFDACDDWQVPARGLPEIAPEGLPRVLVIGTTRDPATPYEWSQRLSEALPGSVLLTFDGDGHTAYLQTGAQCIDEIVDEFLLDGSMPPPGTTCEADYE